MTIERTALTPLVALVPGALATLRSVASPFTFLSSAKIMPD